MKTIIMPKLAVNHVALYCVLIRWSAIKLFETDWFMFFGAMVFSVQRFGS